MKVVHKTATHLVIEDRPWLIGILMILMALGFVVGGMALWATGQYFGGLMLVLVGGGVPLLVAGMMVQRVRLTFDREAGRITRTCRSVLGLTQDTFALDRLEAVRVGVSTDSDGTTYRTELRLKAPIEVVPFTSYYTSGRKPEQMADAVNEWLTTAGASNR
jgi:hypothetical protein